MLFSYAITSFSIITIGELIRPLCILYSGSQHLVYTSWHLTHQYINWINRIEIPLKGAQTQLTSHWIMEIWIVIVMNLFYSMGLWLGFIVLSLWFYCFFFRYWRYEICILFRFYFKIIHSEICAFNLFAVICFLLFFYVFFWNTLCKILFKITFCTLFLFCFLYFNIIFLIRLTITSSGFLFAVSPDTLVSLSDKTSVFQHVPFTTGKTLWLAVLVGRIDRSDRSWDAVCFFCRLLDCISDGGDTFGTFCQRCVYNRGNWKTFFWYISMFEVLKLWEF